MNIDCKKLNGSINCMIIRNAKLEDVDRINVIHNQAINEKFKLAYVTPWTNDMMLEWFREHNNRNVPPKKNILQTE
jgi:L-amino acid N-acyltransferase YncA